jgi:anti-sigma regulatory factor (Ser/Thr protein kinase)
MIRPDLNAVTRWITAAALAHPHALRDEVMRRTGLTRRSAGRVLRRLEQANWLVRAGTARRPVHGPGLLRQVVHQYALAGLQEDQPWAHDFAPCFALPATVQRMVEHGFQELLNNAIDHSEGERVTVSMRQTPSHIQLLVSDDGRGIFDKVGALVELNDAAQAMLQLSRGRLTSAPQRHRGHGLFFTARLADVFGLHANGTGFQRLADGDWQRAAPLVQRGTSAFVGIALETRRTLDDVLTRHSLDQRGYGLESTQLPLQLIQSERITLDSRAQARRVAQGLASFRRVEVDFARIDHIGHGFADELFRVQARELPQLEMVPINMSRRVAAMLDSVRASPL